MTFFILYFLLYDVLNLSKYLKQYLLFSQRLATFLPRRAYLGYKFTEAVVSVSLCVATTLDFFSNTIVC